MLFVSYFNNTSFSQDNSSTIENIGLEINQLAPNFNLLDPVKGKISIETFLGKPLFIFFTSTWCTPCQIGAENLAKFDNEIGGDLFNVLIVFVDESETNSQFIDWKKKFGNDDWYVAKGIDMAKIYDVKFLDTKYIFDKEGIIKWIDLKPLEYNILDSLFRELL